jgi:hypothetical protein
MRRCDRDSPIEQTGEAHLVTTSCETCGTHLRVAETAAEEGVWCDVCSVALPELALVERSLRASDASAVEVRIGAKGARIRFMTHAGNERYRNRLAADVCRAVEATDWWRLHLLHDPLRLESAPLVDWLITLRRIDRTVVGRDGP